MESSYEIHATFPFVVPFIHNNKTPIYIIHIGVLDPDASKRDHALYTFVQSGADMTEFQGTRSDMIYTQHFSQT